MPTFLLGLLLAALSGVGTYAYTSSGQLTAIVAAVVAVCTWCSAALILILDD